MYNAFDAMRRSTTQVHLSIMTSISLTKSRRYLTICHGFVPRTFDLNAELFCNIFILQPSARTKDTLSMAMVPLLNKARELKFVVLTYIFILCFYEITLKRG